MAMFPIHPGSTHSSVLDEIRYPGNRSAWERFYGQYAPYVRALGRRDGLRHADAEDVVQTVFAEIAGRIGRFGYDRAKGSFHAWLARAARFRIMDLLWVLEARLGKCGEARFEELLELWWEACESGRSDGSSMLLRDVGRGVLGKEFFE